MSNIESNKIRIFPSTSRGADIPAYGDNFVTEYNLSSIVNKLLRDSGTTAMTESGFLITTSNDISSNVSDTVLEFNIGGYFVTTTIGDVLNSLNTDSSGSVGTSYENFVRFSIISSKVYAQATQYGAEDNSNVAYWKLQGEDGVGISDSPSTSSSAITYSLPIFNVSGTSGSYAYVSLCDESKLRFNNINIDDGEIWFYPMFNFCITRLKSTVLEVIQRINK